MRLFRKHYRRVKTKEKKKVRHLKIALFRTLIFGKVIGNLEKILIMYNYPRGTEGAYLNGAKGRGIKNFKRKKD
jgi:hypothetical protein